VSNPPDLSRCPGCGLQLPELGGPTPVDVGASPACWALYGRLLVAEYGRAPSARLHQLTVDSYGAQHPSVRQDRSNRSLGLHLIGLCLLLERGASAQQTRMLLARILERPPSFGPLEAPTRNGTITVSDVAAALNPDDHARLVERWATSVWNAWAAHHDTVRAWIDGNRSGRPQADSHVTRMSFPETDRKDGESCAN
jgi:Family of unknown function (DUF5946)